MSEKVVYQLDEDGYLAGTTTADPSPLEPGVFLLPGGCVEQEPPKNKKGKRLRWQGSDWVYVTEPKEEEAPQEKPDPPTLEQAMARRQDAYRQEADPLKTEAEFDAMTAENGPLEPDYSSWLSKVREIKARYPLPVIS